VTRRYVMLSRLHLAAKMPAEAKRRKRRRKSDELLNEIL
jgi:hypothetical protein